MLILNLAEVARGPVRVHGEIAPDAPLWEDTEVALAGPLRVDIDARTVGDGVLVRGEIRGGFETSCRRCLAPLAVDARDDMDVFFERLTPEEVAEAELGGEVHALPQRGDRLDLGPTIREQVLLRIPEYVLCAESCRGLCPRCGVNLNRESCGCVPPVDEGPWGGLKKIRFD